MDPKKHLPLGKLPVEMLAKLVERAPVLDERVLLGPGIGLDCAVLDMGASLLVIKTDPITFATDEIGWYTVQINANDIATTGATPRWLMATVLLPEGRTNAALVDQISEQLFAACRQEGISFIGGHTEITHGIDRPIIAGTMIGEVERDKLVTPRGASPGDRVLLTKGVPIEATAILAREFPQRLSSLLTAAELQQAADFLHTPGIGVSRDARIACAAGQVTAMHDPTEGGLAAALWEMAEACGHTLVIDSSQVHVPELSARICAHFGLEPLNTIASGALLLAVKEKDAEAVRKALTEDGIPCTVIGWVDAGPPQVEDAHRGAEMLLPRPERDEITSAYEQS
jgi:hydrogenase maturation factor